MSRRGALIAGAAAVLAACSDDPAPGAAGTGSHGAGHTASTEVRSLGSLQDSVVSLIQRFPSTPLFVPGEVRLPVSLGTVDGVLSNVPEQLVGEVVDADGVRVATFRAPVRREGLPFPYFAVRATVPKAGLYTIRADVGGRAEAAFQIYETSEVAVPYLGSTLPGFATPTSADGRGVDPICTLEPTPCPFHERTLSEALAAGKPVVYLVGTPAHCQTGACAPGLEFLVASQRQSPGALSVVHAEVYTNNLASTVAPAVKALKLDYEPVVYVTDAKGVIVDRLDGVWDRSELDEALAKVS